MPHELIGDNNTSFISRTFKASIDECDILQRFQYAYVSSGNGTVEIYHMTVKQIAAKKLGVIQEAIYWYNRVG